MILHYLINDISTWWHKVNFNGEERIELYRSLSVLMRNKIKLDDALRKLYEVYSKNGKKRGSRKAIIVWDCLQSISNGKPLSTALSRWVPNQESTLIKSGEESGTITKSFAEAVKIIQVKGKLLGSIAKATIYPLMLSVGLAVLLYITANDVMPKISRVSNPDLWEGSARWLYLLSELTVAYGLYVAIFLVSLTAASIISLPYLKGSIRIKLDRIPPYSLYRMLHGSSFLLNISVMMSAGIQMQEALNIISKGSSPWLKQRVNSALHGIGLGKNLGEALDISGYEFPDREAIPFISILADTGNLDEVLPDYANEWLEESVRNIDKIANWMLAIGIILIGLVIALILAGLNEISSYMQSLN
ncbi:type II secretion system F family protein [Yersinia enterocolitica]